MAHTKLILLLLRRLTLREMVVFVCRPGRYVQPVKVKVRSMVAQIPAVVKSLAAVAKLILKRDLR
jgi:hypothetical protein